MHTINGVTINAIDSLGALKSVLNAPETERLEAFRTTLMEPIRPLWEQSLRFMPGLESEPDLPIAAAKRFSFFTPDLDAKSGLAALEQLETAQAHAVTVTALEQAVHTLDPIGHGVQLPEVNFAFILANPDGMDSREGSYTGVGNTPGWIMLLAWPTAYNLPRLSAIVVHELNHNVRFAFEPMWPMTLGQYIVAEGLAEAFAAGLYGEDMLGHWTTSLRGAELQAVLPRFREAINEPDFNVIRGYIFGDWAADQFGYAHQGLPDFAGYAVGYHVVRMYLERSGKSAAQATYVSWREIVEGSGFLDT